MRWSLLSITRPLDIPPGVISPLSYLGGYPQTSRFTPNTLTFPSLLFGVLGHFLSLVTLWS